MSTKTKILELLENNRDISLSGEDIASKLSISRAAVWKAVKSLEKEGYEIEAGTNKGYSLSKNCNMLSVQGLLPYLNNKKNAENIYIYKSLESTNITAKEMALKGAAHGTVIIADTQTSGRGRRGRSFYSPSKSGLYMSVILHSELLNIDSITLITPAVAVAVSRAVKAVTGKETSIKWVNDVLLDDKKICGILTEAVTDFESGGIDWIVTGIGINIDTNDFPDEMQQTATSIFKEESALSIRNQLAAELINILLSDNAWLKDKTTYAEYKERMTMLGHKITVFQGDETYEAVALDIDDQCRLLVKKPDGTIVVLSAGEVSTRRMD